METQEQELLVILKEAGVEAILRLLRSRFTITQMAPLAC